jgi:hypothetical protein
MYLNVRLNEVDDKDLIDDVERFTGNKKFTRSDRVKELMRIGKHMEQKSMAVMLSTGRSLPREERATPPPPTEPRKTTPSKPLVQTKDGWHRINLFGK